MSAWKCYARPAALGGRTCGHVNETELVFHNLVCCNGCGATKIASDHRQRKEEAKVATAKTAGAR